MATQHDMTYVPISTHVMYIRVQKTGTLHYTEGRGSVGVGLHYITRAPFNNSSQQYHH